jgi:uncharacterized repeat protein (TIGR01451 family)
MMRTTTGMLQAMMVLGAVAAAGCSAQAPDAASVETHASALSGPSGLALQVDVPPSINVSQPSGITATIFVPPTGASDVTIRFDLAGSFTLGPPLTRSLPPIICATPTVTPGGATVSCHADQMTSNAQVRLPLTATAGGTISSLITLTAGGVLQASDKRSIMVVTADSADLSISGYADYSTFVGNASFASFYVNNAGPLPATGAVVTFTLNGPGIFNSVSPDFWSGVPATCSFTPNSATCTADSLPVFAYVPISISFTATAPGDVSIAASVGANELDRVPTNNTFTTVTNAVQPRYADLSVALTPGHQSVIGMPVDYALTVTNKGPDAAALVSLYDPLPGGMTFVSATASQGSCYGGEWGVLQCDLGAIAAGASANVALVVKPTVLAQVTNTVTVYDSGYGDIDTDYGNNQASATITVHGSTNQLVTGPPTKGGCGLWPGGPIDSLEDGDPTLRLGSKEIGGWFVTSDGTGVQAPSSPAGLVVAGGTRGSKFMVSSSGYGFWSWGAALGIGLGCPYDVSRFHAVRFDVKAGGQRQFFVEVPTVELLDVANGGQCTSNCFDYYRAPISLPDDSWYQCTVAFADLRQAGFGLSVPFDVGAVTGTQFNIEAWQAPYDLSIDNVAFVAPPKTKSGCVRIAH